MDVTASRLEAALVIRSIGNARFKEGKHVDAAAKYEKALRYLLEDGNDDVEDKQLNDARLPCFLNLAACQIKLKKWQGMGCQIFWGLFLRNQLSSHPRRFECLQ